MVCRMNINLIDDETLVRWVREPFDKSNSLYES